MEEFWSTRKIIDISGLIDGGTVEIILFPSLYLSVKTKEIFGHLEK